MFPAPVLQRSRPHDPPQARIGSEDNQAETLLDLIALLRYLDLKARRRVEAREELDSAGLEYGLHLAAHVQHGSDAQIRPATDPLEALTLELQLDDAGQVAVEPDEILRWCVDDAGRTGKPVPGSVVAEIVARVEGDFRNVRASDGE